MDKLEIKAQNDSPEILLDAEERLIKFTGKSYPEDSFDFYEPILQWLQEYIELDSSKEEMTNVYMNIIYMNSSSFKVFFDIFDIIEKGLKNGLTFDIKWVYDEENDVMEEAGEEFQEDFESLNIQMIATT